MNHNLPSSLQELQRIGFYLDHLNSMTGFSKYMHSLGMHNLGTEIVEETASGFLKSRVFDPETATLPSMEKDVGLVENWRAALVEIHQKFGDRLPVHFYNVMLFQGLRPNSETEVKMPEVEYLLPDGMRWQVGDAVCHSLPLCTRLYLDIQTIFYRHSGRIMVHGCGCGSCAPGVHQGGGINIPMSDDPSVSLEETESVVRHFMTQLIPLHWEMPHSIGKSMTAQMIDLRAKQCRELDFVAV